MNPLRICIVCHEYPPMIGGGIGTYTRKLGRALVEAGHEVRVVGVYADVEAGCQDDSGIEVWRIRSARGPAAWIADRIRLYRMISRWSRRGEIDLIELPDWLGWAAGWPRLPVPVVVRLHGSAGYFAEEVGTCTSRLVRSVERASLRRADFWCSVSRYTEEKTRAVFDLPARPCTVIHPPIDLRPVTTMSDRSRNRVVYTGALTAKKGVVSLIRAWPRVHSHRPDAVLRILGRDVTKDDGESMQAFLQRNLDDATSRSVQFCGFVPHEELHQSLATARVAVFPSYAEAFSVAPAEAMVQGCPTVFSSRTSGPELIQHGTDGLLVDADDPDEIATAIIDVLDNDALAEQLSVKGRARCEQLSTASLLPQYEAFYRSCIAGFQDDNFRQDADPQEPSRR